MKEFLYKNSGITLISLVITIVILIILVGISILGITNNGIIDRTKFAKEEYKNVETNEIEIIESMADQVNTITDIKKPNNIEYTKQ